jgi:hypothetical protein
MDLPCKAAMALSFWCSSDVTSMEMRLIEILPIAHVQAPYQKTHICAIKTIVGREPTQSKDQFSLVKHSCFSRQRFRLLSRSHPKFGLR